MGGSEGSSPRHIIHGLKLTCLLKKLKALILLSTPYKDMPDSTVMGITVWYIHTMGYLY